MDEYVDNVKNMKDVYSIPWKMFLDNDKTCNTYKAKDLKVLIICNPCMGFGDIVFGMKFFQYLKEWYNCDLQIATTNPGGFKQLGMKDNIFLLKSKSKNLQCRKVSRLHFYTMDGERVDVPDVDLIFIAPLTADYDADYKDVKNLIPYSNKLNTFFLSEYNDSARKNIDFHTGIGNNRYGLFLTDTPDGEKLNRTKNPYSLIYIAETISRATSCYSSFIEMIVKKYHSKYSKFDIVVPEWIAESIKKNKKLIKLLSRYYENIEVVVKGWSQSGTNNTLFIRGDILPLPNTDMMRLIKHSVRDILLTGDQSITDALSCCSTTKNIFYQIAPWKENFGKQLSKELPNKYLKKKSTSCGTINAIKYNSKYKNFNSSWDFRVLARPKMDAIMMYSKTRKSSKIIKYLEELIFHTRNLTSLKRKIELLF